MSYRYVRVDLEDFDTQDLIEELEERGVKVIESGNEADVANEVWQLRRLGKSYDHLIDKWLHDVLGKVI